MELILKEHVKGGVLTVSLCDNDIQGSKFEEDNKVLDLSTSYYRGEIVSPEVAKEMIQRARSATIVGIKATKLASTIFPESQISKIDNVPFMNIMKF